jgi:hypothetical protein
MRKAVVVTGTRETTYHNEKTETIGLRVIFALLWRFLSRGSKCGCSPSFAKLIDCED